MLKFFHDFIHFYMVLLMRSTVIRKSCFDFTHSYKAIVLLISSKIIMKFCIYLTPFYKAIILLLRSKISRNSALVLPIVTNL